MTYAIFAVLTGLALLVWSADRFVEGSAAAARHFKVPPLLIGMIIVGFGTSAPELLVSALAASQGNPGLALGNAYSSNITNIAFILGLTALINPVTVKSGILRSELPILVAVTGLAAWQLVDGTVTRFEASTLLFAFALLLGWSIWQSRRRTDDALTVEVAEELDSKPSKSLSSSLVWLVVGLLLLIASSRLLVWGAVEIAQYFGISDLIIGLTIVAVGTSLPELASSTVAARKGEHDIALGNILGSNLFNSLAVVGLAGMIRPMSVGSEILHRDIAAMAILTLALFALGYGFRGRPGRINRIEGGGLLVCYLAYLAILIVTA